MKHLDELVKAREAGYEAAVCFVIQMENVRWFAPNDETHPEFGQALRRAAQAGVEILAMDCAVTPQSLTMGKPVPSDCEKNKVEQPTLFQLIVYPRKRGERGNLYRHSCS